MQIATRFIAYQVLGLLVFLSLASFCRANLQEDFSKSANQVGSLFESLPVAHGGRLKPLDTLARESFRFISGKEKLWGINPSVFFVNLMRFQKANQLQLIEVRSAKAKEALGLNVKQRHFSLNDVSRTNLFEKVQPLFAKQEKAPKTLSSFEKELLEVFQQKQLLESIINHQLVRSTLSWTNLTEENVDVVFSTFIDYLNAPSDANAKLVFDKIPTDQKQGLFELDPFGMKLELLYHKLKPFFLASLLALLSVLIFAFSVKPKFVIPLVAATLLLQLSGFLMRIRIMGFAPVTNMYGTMLWVAFGTSFFGSILYILYRDKKLIMASQFLCGAVLLIAESFPLVLSPDLDPITAVLRSNLWLTVHVLTVTISYAAFALAMILSNATLLQIGFGKLSNFKEKLKRQVHYVYRLIQLGVLLLSAGIILGGIWADYSWGRFWGWDPKETWALIADLGFLLVLHARFVGWLKEEGILIASVFAFMLVIMAWYGVNFVLATGLHSYGFSSGGASFIAAYLGLQFSILALYWILKKRSLSKS